MLISLMSLVAHYYQSLSQIPLHEATRNIATLPGYIGCLSLVVGNPSGFPDSLLSTHLYSWVERGTVRVTGFSFSNEG